MFSHLPPWAKTAIDDYERRLQSGEIDAVMGVRRDGQVSPADTSKDDPYEWIGEFLAARLPAMDVTADARPVHRETLEESVTDSEESFTTYRSDGRETFG